MTEEDRKILLKSQQGELDAVCMYDDLADACSDPLDRATFKQLAEEEEHHASIFQKLTGKTLKPKKGQAVLVSMSYRIIGKKKLYPKIAQAEYEAAENHERLAQKFPEIQSVKNDEQRHGDTIMALLN